MKAKALKMSEIECYLCEKTLDDTKVVTVQRDDQQYLVHEKCATDAGKEAK